MTLGDIIELWMKHTNYDPDRKSFYLGSMISEAHTCTKLMSQLTNEYDTSGTLAVLYAKSCYEEMLNEFRVKLSEFVKDRSAIQEYWDMWEAFNSPVIHQAEDRLVAMFNNLVTKVSGVTLLGEGDRENDLKLLYASVQKVTESLCKCKVESFLKGLPNLGALDHISSVIEVFPTLAQYLRVIENRVDGVYIAYISQYSNAGGYFTFILKSNGNIISLNDRIDESYVGQHGNCRNGRWQEQALFDLFPYDEILDFSNRDYKGYATKWTVKESDDNSIPLKTLTQESYMSLLLALILIIGKYANADVSAVKHKILDTLLTPNLTLLEAHCDTTALVPVNNSAIVAYANEWKPTIGVPELLDKDYGMRFDWKDKEKLGKTHEETGTFRGYNQEFVDWYADDFVFDASQLLFTPNRLSITDGQPHMKYAEFVGTTDKFEMEAYRQGRKQLADHIQKRMIREFEEFGGHEAVMKWFYELVTSNKDVLINLALDQWQSIMIDKTENNYERSFCWVPCSTTLKTTIEESHEHYMKLSHSVNVPLELKGWGEDKYAEKWKCPVTGTTANVWFNFLPCSYKEIERIFGVEVPHVMKGYTITSPVDGFAKGNSILSSTDAVADIDHIYTSQSSTARLMTGRTPSSKFEFSIGLSKRGLNKLLKERQING